SPVKLTPKSTTQQQTFNLCRSRGGNQRGLSVCQAVCTSMKAHGCSRRGNAATPVDLIHYHCMATSGICFP
ncbi:Os07g0442800, partial [Oryza sativa Japonica Group]